MVRDAKFGKHRLVPLHPSAGRALARYVALCADERSPARLSPALFLSTAGTRLLHSNVSLTFARLAAAGRAHPALGVLPAPDRMTCDIPSRWLPCWAGTATAPTSPAMMPRLSTYLGHTDPKHTYWYLSAAPELMALAGERLRSPPGTEDHEHPRPHPAGVLHRPAGAAAPGQRPHDRRLPGRAQAAAGLRRPADRQDPLPAGHHRPGRAADRRVPQPPGNRPRQQRPDPQRPAGGDPLAVPATPRCATPSTPRSSSGSWRSRPNASTRP